MSSHEAPLVETRDFATFYQNTHLQLFRYVYALHGGPPAEVEDLTAEAFLRAWKARQSFSGSDRAAQSWLFKIARNLVIDVFRRGQSDAPIQQMETIDLPSPDSGPEQTVIAGEEAENLLAALQTLSLDQKEMIVLRYGMGWKVKEIADHLDMLENTVSVNLRRSLEKIKNRWPEYQEPHS
jgi:RNA polymerase sigma-70 factor, ECF subfamily